MKQLKLLAATLLVGWASLALAADEPAFYLVRYEPGSNWDSQLDYQSQVGIKAHKAHLQKLYDNDLLLMGGPLIREDGALLLIKVSSFEEAQSIIDRDPGVVNGILTATVSGWQLEMSAMRRFKRNTPEVTEADQTYTLERLDPQSPLNMKKE